MVSEEFAGNPNRPARSTDSSQGTVVFLNRDLFFGVRLQQLMTDAGWSLRLVPSSDQFLRALREDPYARLGLIDLGATPDWSVIAEAIASEAELPPIIAFGPHKDVDAFRAAKAAGVKRVISNGEFHRSALTLIERYALPPNQAPE